jgi:hypothetical protein
MNPIALLIGLILAMLGMLLGGTGGGMPPIGMPPAFPPPGGLPPGLTPLGPTSTPPATAPAGAAPLPLPNAPTQLEAQVAGQVISLLNQQRSNTPLNQAPALDTAAFNTAIRSWTQRSAPAQSPTTFSVDIGPRVDLARLTANYFPPAAPPAGTATPGALPYQAAELAALVVQGLQANAGFSGVAATLPQAQAQGRLRSAGVGVVLRPQGSQVSGGAGILAPAVLVLQ